MPGKTISLAVICSLMFVGLFLLLGGGLVVEYFLMNNHVHQLLNTIFQSSLKTSKVTCQRLLGMDQAHVGGINLTIIPKRYQPIGASLNRLGTSIHNLYTGSTCPQLLSGHYKLPGS